MSFCGTGQRYKKKHTRRKSLNKSASTGPCPHSKATYRHAKYKFIKEESIFN